MRCFGAATPSARRKGFVWCAQFQCTVRSVHEGGAGAGEGLSQRAARVPATPWIRPSTMSVQAPIVQYLGEWELAQMESRLNSAMLPGPMKDTMVPGEGWRRSMGLGNSNGQQALQGVVWGESQAFSGREAGAWASQAPPKPCIPGARHLAPREIRHAPAMSPPPQFPHQGALACSGPDQLHGHPDGACHARKQPAPGQGHQTDRSQHPQLLDLPPQQQPRQGGSEGPHLGRESAQHRDQETQLDQQAQCPCRDGGHQPRHGAASRREPSRGLG